MNPHGGLRRSGADEPAPWGVWARPIMPRGRRRVHGATAGGGGSCWLPRYATHRYVTLGELARATGRCGVAATAALRGGCSLSRAVSQGITSLLFFEMRRPHSHAIRNVPAASRPKWLEAENRAWSLAGGNHRNRPSRPRPDEQRRYRGSLQNRPRLWVIASRVTPYWDAIVKSRMATYIGGERWVRR